jgi:hypothetical protein
VTIIDKLRKQIADAEERILEIQKACPHPDAAIIVRSIGRGECYDVVWRNCECGLCEAVFIRTGEK